MLVWEKLPRCCKGTKVGKKIQDPEPFHGFQSTSCGRVDSGADLGSLGALVNCLRTWHAATFPGQMGE